MESDGARSKRPSIMASPLARFVQFDQCGTRSRSVQAPSCLRFMLDARRARPRSDPAAMRWLGRYLDEKESTLRTSRRSCASWSNGGQRSVRAEPALARPLRIEEPELEVVSAS
jgi:hypothetical protein